MIRINQSKLLPTSLAFSANGSAKLVNKLHKSVSDVGDDELSAKL